MKVGIDVSPVIYGTGVSDYTLELVRYLPRHILVPVGFSLRRRHEFARILPGTTTYPIPPTALHFLWNKLHVYNFENFAPGNIDIYHSSDWAQAPDSNPKITTVHDLAPLVYPSETDSGVVAAHRARLGWVARECDRIICVSSSTQADLHRLYPATKNRTIVIPEALPSRFLLRPRPRDTQPFLLAIGARQPRKNILRLISAFTKFQAKYCLPPKLVIVGESVHSGEIHPGIHFTGYLSNQELVDRLAGAAALVYPSLYEGFGLPILGAWHHRIPVACSDIPAFRETADRAAIYFNPLDEEAIASGVAQAVKSRTKLVKLGASQLGKYSWDHTAATTLQVYTSVC